MQRFVALRRAGDGVDVHQATRGLDDQLEADALLAALGGLDLGAQHVEGVDILGHVDLGQHDQVEPLAGVLHQVDHVAVHVVGIGGVDAHRDRLAAPVQIVDGVDHQLAGALLVVRGDRVFQVEEHDIGVRLGRLLEEPGVGAGHGQLAAVDAGRGLFDGKKCHDRLFWVGC